MIKGIDGNLLSKVHLLEVLSWKHAKERRSEDSRGVAQDVGHLKNHMQELKSTLPY
jgi:hypothetical protein